MNVHIFSYFLAVDVVESSWQHMGFVSIDTAVNPGPDTSMHSPANKLIRRRRA